MPIYDFHCTKCGKPFEKLVRNYDSPPPVCADETCQGPSERAEVTALRRFGDYANQCSVRFHFNFPSDRG
jgi:putative FmdB family regulatory protein